MTRCWSIKDYIHRFVLFAVQLTSIGVILVGVVGLVVVTRWSISFFPIEEHEYVERVLNVVNVAAIMFCEIRIVWVAAATLHSDLSTITKLNKLQNEEALQQFARE